jgi:peroxiredoxin
MESKLNVGDQIVGGVLYKINPEGIHESRDAFSLFIDKRVLVFGGPVPFGRLDTQQAKEYAELSTDLLAAGLDAVHGIYCQDAFVMREFDNRIKQDFPNHKVDFYADGDAFFTRAHKLEFNFTFQGLSIRSIRYAMVVKNKVIEHVVVDPFEVIEKTAATKILEWLKNSK